jgi:hypothetical protein
MPWYRIGEPGHDHAAHLNFGRKGGPAPCKAAALPGDNRAIGAGCFRTSIALCDGPVGTDLDGTPLTCDMPICEHHRTKAGDNVDYCPRHQHLAGA